MAEKTRTEILRERTVESIQKKYEDGDITAATRNRVIREKARLTVADQLEQRGFAGAIFERSIEHVQEGWNNLLKAAQREPTLSPGTEAFAVGQAVWGQIQILMAPLTAIGEVTGQQAENMALAAGASPGLARVINISTDVATGFAVPSGAIARVSAKVVTKVAGKTMTSAEAIAAGMKVERGLESGAEVAERITKEIAERVPEAFAKFGKAIDRSQVDELSALATRALTEKTEAAERAFSRFATGLFTGPVAPDEKIKFSKQFMDLLTEWAPEAVARGDLRLAMTALAIDLMHARPEHITQLVTKARARGGVWEGMREFYINLLLPFSSIPSLIGNSVAIGLSVAERATSSPREAFYFAKGMTLAIGDGLAAFGKAFADAPTSAGRFDFPIEGAIGGVTGRIIRKPGEVVRGVDNLFRVINQRGSYYASAVREGLENNLTGKALGEFIQERVINPTLQMVREADDLATNNTFQNQLGPIARRVRGFIQHKTGPGGFQPGVAYFPFLKSGVNTVKYAWDRTPFLQFFSKQLYADIRAGGRRANAAIERLTMGNMLGFYFSELAKEGLVTGSGPADAGARSQWLATHEPYSIKIGGKWVSYKNWEPLSHILGTVADYTQIMDQLPEPVSGQAAHAIVYAITANLGNNSWWRQASGLVDIVQGDVPGEAALKTIMKPVTTVVTLGPLVSRTARALDPVTRDARTVVDSFVNNIPVYSKTLPARRDAYGDPIIPAVPAGSPWFGYLAPLWPRTTDVETDRVKREGDRVQARPGRWPDTIGGHVPSTFSITAPAPGGFPGVQLTPQQKDRWQEIYREELRNPKTGIEKQLLDSKEYQNLSLGAQRDEFTGFLSDYRSRAQELLFIEDRELFIKALEAEGAGFTLQLPVAERPAMRRQIRESIDFYKSLTPEELENLLKFGEFPEEAIEAPVTLETPEPEASEAPTPALRPTPRPAPAPTPQVQRPPRAPRGDGINIFRGATPELP